MPELSIQITADLNNAKRNLELLKDELRDLKQSLSNNDKAIAGVNKQLDALNTRTKEGKAAAAGLKAQLQSLTAVNNTLTTGISSVKNEIASETDNLKKLAKDLKAAENSSSGFANGIGKAFSGLRTLANIIPGIGIGGLIGLLAGPLVDALAGAFDGFNKTAESAKNMKDAFASGKDEFVKATLEVSNLKIAFEQARDGIISKEEALKLYNTTIGKTTGEVKSLDEAEKALSKNAEAYIRFTLLKAASNYALGKAAEAAFKAEEERNRQAKEFKNTLVDTRIVGPGSTVFNAQEFEEEKKRVAKAQEERKQTAIKKAQEASDAQLKIAQKFLDDAEKISKEFKFDFNGIQEPKPEAVKKVKEKLVKALKFKPDDLEKIFFDEATVKLQVPAFVELDFKKSLTGQGKSLDDGLLSGILGPEELTEVTAKAKLAALGVTEGFQDGLKIGVAGLRFPQLIALAKSAEEEAAAMLALTQDTFINIATGIGEGIGQAFADGSGFLSNAAESILHALGSFIVQLGKAAIIASKIYLALKAAAKNPITGIVAGIAAIAVGYALQQVKLPKFADGVQNFGGGLAVVGERGPEVVRLPKGSDVIPNHQLGGLSGSTNVFIPDVRIRGNDLVLVFNRATQTIGRNG